MIAIVNISPKHTPAHGLNQYVLKIDRDVICHFQRVRTFDGLAQCLRAAADAVELQQSLGDAA
jgi:hypothetical protein